MITTCVVVVVHASRFLSSKWSNAVYELVVCMIAMIAVAVFLLDVHSCNLANGICKFSILLLIANSIPILFNYEDPADSSDDGDTF